MKKFRTILPIILLLLIPVSAYAINWPSRDDINAMMTHLLANIPNVIRLIVATSYVIGIALIYKAVHRLRAYGVMTAFMPGNAQFTGPLLEFIIGLCLLFFPSIINTSIYTLWGYGSSSVQAYPDALGHADWAPAIKGAVAIVRVVGYIAFIRGMLLIAKSSGGQGSPQGMFGKGMIHVIGGILAINIVGTVDVIKGTLGLLAS